MIICELGFEEPDKNPRYSFREVDFYAFVPYQSQIKYGVKSHRLSLRKNLEENKFEVYRYYYDEKREEIAFSGEFEMALEFANKETNKFWGFFGYREKDKPCSHKYPNIDTYFCPKGDEKNVL
jgi:hypothetical protein